MPSLKKILLILGLLTLFVTINEGSVYAQEDKSIKTSTENSFKNGATYPARIMAPKAIVYADENMNSPLGFISNGKLITVGNPRKLNRDLVPLIVHGRMAFIQIKDIRYEDEKNELLTSKTGAPREHDIDVILQRPEEKLAENNSGYFTFGQHFVAGELNELSKTVGAEEKNTMSTFGAQFIHRQEVSRYFWGAAFEYSFASTEVLDFGFFTINPTVGYTFLKNSIFMVETYGSFDFSITTVMDIKNNFENESGGFVYGPQINARIVLFPEKKYHLTGGIGYKYYDVVELDTLTDANGNEIKGIDSISGMQLFMGFGIKF